MFGASANVYLYIQQRMESVAQQISAGLKTISDLSTGSWILFM